MSYTSPTPVQVGQSGQIIWGTAPQASGSAVPVAPIVSSMVVTSISLTPANATALEHIENGDGAVTDSIYLLDGFDGEVEGIFNKTLTYPALLSTVTVVLPVAVCFDQAGATPTVYHTYIATVESNPLKFERKGKAMITFKISHRTARDGNPSA
jgi:hypothetical protein